ncbi:MAG: MBL fold metallo-hydrolase [Ignavibacteria bacterium]|jgi:L-ascorbate metabolism protein UlaG (beta-lactamase superfamily)
MMKRREFLKIFSAGSFGIMLSGIFEKLFAATDSLEPKEAPFKPDLSYWTNDKINFCWIGHSTYLINFYGKIILTDPVFSNRIGLYALITNLGPKRIIAPAVRPEKIPQPDLILLSHAHFDHMDYPTLKYFAEKFSNKIPVITAFKTKDVIENLPFKEIIELDWDETTEISDLKIRAIRVKHFGWRYPWQEDRSKGFQNGRSFNAYIIERMGKKIFFGGDTAYIDWLKKYGNENIDVAIMPIGAYNPWRMSHCDPEEALMMADDLKAKYFLPMHTRTFPHGREPFDEPVQWLKKSAPKYKTQVMIYEVGETFTL